MAAHKALALLREVIRMKKTAHTVIREGNVYTIAAVNNNGVGVCGIAGGDAAKGVPGVQLMSRQIFMSTPAGDIGGDGALAITWGAAHGAVLQIDLHLNGGVAAAVQDLAAQNVNDLDHLLHGN